MRIAVAVLAFDRPRYTIQLLESLEIANQKTQFDVLLYQDGSLRHDNISETVPRGASGAGPYCESRYVHVAQILRDFHLKSTVSSRLISANINLAPSSILTRIMLENMMIYDGILLVPCDVVLSRSALDFVKNIAHQFEDDPKTVQLNLIGMHSELMPNKWSQEDLGYLDFDNGARLPWACRFRWLKKLEKYTDFFQDQYHSTIGRSHRELGEYGYKDKDNGEDASFYWKIFVPEKLGSLVPHISRAEYRQWLHITSSDEDGFKERNEKFPWFFTQIGDDQDLVSHDRIDGIQYKVIDTYDHREPKIPNLSK